MAIIAGRFGATDGERVITGGATDLVALAADLGKRLARRPRRQGPGRRGRDRDPLGRRGELGARPRHDGRRLPDRPRAAGLRASRAGRRRGPRRRARRRREGPDVAGGRGGRGGGRPGGRRSSDPRAGGPPARAARAVRPRAPPARGRAAAGRGALGHGAGRHSRRRRPAGGDRPGDDRADRRAAGRDLRPRGPRVHDRLAAAARRGVLQRARADQETARQDRLLDRRTGPRTDPRRARDRRQGRGLARADQAEEHLSRLAARVDR